MGTYGPEQQEVFFASMPLAFRSPMSQALEAGVSTRCLRTARGISGLEVHAALTKTYQPLEFAIPPQATAGGALTLTWTRPAGGGGAGRGCQVAEVWLMRRP